MNLRRASIVYVSLLLACAPSLPAAPVPNTDYAKATLIVYNKNEPESRELAVFYAKERAIPVDNIIALDCSDKETISRKQFNETIAEPMRKFMTSNGLWKLDDTARGKVATESKIHIVALMKGVPMRIGAEPLAPTGKVDANGKPVPPKENKQQTDAASVDSELAMLSLDAAPLNSMGRNPFFKQDRPKMDAGIAAMFLVGRIDGPDWATAKRLIVDAIAAEKTGLWGNAYLDLSRMDVTKGPGYKIGDEWLRNIAKGYHMTGIPTYVDKHPARLPLNFPMGDDIALYFGWYSNTPDGPFANPNFKFKQGAVACHIHSYSATTIRTTTQRWVGPLLDHGAAAVLGNVYEPFLTLTTHLDLFNARLLAGYTFIEAGWMATPGISWMNIMVGDPLYQPFFPTREYGRQPDGDFKALRLAVTRWRDEPELFDKLDEAAKALKSAKIDEASGLRYRYDLKLDKAAAQFAKAGAAYEKKTDKLRMEIYRVELLRSQDKKKEAIVELRKLLPEYKDIPEGKALQALLNQLDPPPPPPPPAK